MKQHPPVRRRIVLEVLVVLAVLAVLSAGASAAQELPAPGLKTVQIPATGSYFLRYVPPGLTPGPPIPVIVFFHGSGGRPFDYVGFLTEAARQAGAVLVVPKSRNNLGWGEPADELTVTESLRLVREALPVDARRISVAGHSAGGAYAYLLAYQTRSGFSAVFSMASRFYPVSAVADPSYKAPIRMYYGTADPNYLGGSYDALKQQWQRLGIPWEEEIRPGAEHRELPESAVVQGFRFLVGKSYPGAAASCVPSATRLCLGDGRFQVEIAWRDFAGTTGVGSVVPVGAGDSGLFWFFAPDNWEMLVKVLDGCALNGHHWVFAAATTTVEHTLTVTDTLTGETAVYHNPLGRPSATITDTGALSGCS
jgi:predicted esterase